MRRLWRWLFPDAVYRDRAIDAVYRDRAIDTAIASLQAIINRYSGPRWTAVHRPKPGVLYDVDFIRDSYRQGESYDPLNATLPED